MRLLTGFELPMRSLRRRYRDEELDEAAVQIVNDAFPSDSDDVRTWAVCARLLPHALAAAEHAEALQVVSEATGRLLNQAGLYLKGRAEFAEAKVALETIERKKREDTKD